MKIVAVTRDLGGDKRRQHVLEFLGQKAHVERIRVKLTRPQFLLNLMLSFHPVKQTWREKTKKNSFFFKNMSINIASIIKQKFGEEYDCVLLFEGLYSPGLGRSLCKPYVIYEDTTTEISKRMWPAWVPNCANTERYRRLERSLYTNASAVVTSNELARESLIHDYHVLPERVFTIGQGCNLQYPQWRKRISNNKQVLFVGYEFERKGGKVLLKAFQIVKETIPDSRLVIVGPTIRVEQPGVIVLGRISEKSKLLELYENSQIFVLPAYFDPMPNALLEAMGTGLPVITSRSCGAAEFIQDGINGFLVEAGKVQSLADKMLMMLRNPDVAKAVGRKGFELVRERFDWQYVAECLYHILNSSI